MKTGSVFACALVFSPVRMAGLTACPEGSLARARKDCLMAECLRKMKRGVGLDARNLGGLFQV